MGTNEDYSQKTMEELLAEEQKLKSRKTMTAVIVGFMMGVAIFAAVRGKFLPTIAMILLSYLIGSGYAKSLKKVQSEISRRGAGH